MGFCKGIENYLRYLIGRLFGSLLYILFDYFLKDFIMFIDELYVIIF